MFNYTYLKDSYTVPCDDIIHESIEVPLGRISFCMHIIPTMGTEDLASKLVVQDKDEHPHVGNLTDSWVMNLLFVDLWPKSRT